MRLLQLRYHFESVSIRRPFDCLSKFIKVAASDVTYQKGSVKEPNKFHNYETEKITRKASEAAEYIELFGSSTRDRQARRI